LRRALDWLFRAAGAAGAACVGLIFVVMIGASLGRELNWRVSGANDIVSWLCAAASFFAMAHAFKHGDFVRVTLLYEKLSPRGQHAMNLFSLAIGSAAVAYLTWWATVFTWESYEFAEMATGLVVIPIWIPQATFVLGCWLLLAAVLDEFITVLRGGKPSFQVALEERHAKGDYSSDV
jgi:TRAP-type C4-dicarboxylate transport system permease small subunit